MLSVQCARVRSNVCVSLHVGTAALSDVAWLTQESCPARRFRACGAEPSDLCQSLALPFADF